MLFIRLLIMHAVVLNVPMLFAYFAHLNGSFWTKEEFCKITGDHNTYIGF